MLRVFRILWPVITALVVAPALLSAQERRPGEAQVAPTVQPAPPPGTDSVTVVAGSRYAADGVRAFLLGADYRDLWTTPIRVPVLDLDSFAGGIEPTKRGGGLQTKSLRFRAADGTEYSFRSVDKAPYLAQLPDFRETPVGDVIQDQTSAANPVGALIAAPLLDAAGVLHVEPQLFVLPDDPRLGEFRESFAGLLGLIEMHADEREDEEGENVPGFAGSSRIVSTERLLERIEEDPEERVDSRAYLAARLMDILLGDWDRHAGQWRWAQFERGGKDVFVPIPEDRDNAFVNYDGLALDVGRTFIPNAVTFSEEYENLAGLTLNAQPLDRQLLSDLPAPVWDSVAVALQARLTDGSIEDAVRRLPPEFYELRGPELIRTLQARRDRLPAASAKLYRTLAEVVDVHTTDASELALIERRPDGDLEVRVYANIADEAQLPNDAEPLFRRLFRASETNEVRLFLQGGGDRVIVRGRAARSPGVRVIGGGGDDVLVDSSRVGGRNARTFFYDDRGDNRFVYGPDTRVDERSYEPPATVRTMGNMPPRDRGLSRSVAPWLGWHESVGALLGAEAELTRYGFRKDPYSSQLSLRGEYAPVTGGWALDLVGDWRRANSGTALLLHARASTLDALRFYGFGNDSRNVGTAGRYRVERTQLLLEPVISFALAPPLRLRAGPVLKFTELDGEENSSFEAERPLGADGFGQIGAGSDLVFDNRDHPRLPRHGVRATLGGSLFPPLWDAEGSFGELHASAATYLPIPLLTEPTLALRLGGKRVWGPFPFHEAAFLGGWGSLRGFRRERFVGDAAVYGNAELRVPLTRAKLFLVRGDLGILGLVDAGRVFTDVEPSDEWQTAAGGGLWFSFLDRGATFSAVYGRGDEDRFYFGLGMPF